MKKLLFICLLLAQSVANAQFFNNVNSELCYQLYETGDPVSGYRVYVVVDPENFEEKDMEILKKWDTFTQTEKSRITQRWATEGKRTEAERAPYITYPPVFPNNKTFVPQPINIKPNWSQWEKAKQYWQYKDRPF